MGALLRLLGTSVLTGFRSVGGRAVASKVVQSEGAAIASAADQWAASGTQKAVSALGENVGGFFGKALNWVRGNPVKTTVGAGGVAGVNAANNIWLNFKETAVGKILTNKSSVPWVLGAAAAGGLLLAFKDKIFGASEAPEREASVTPTLQQPSVALTPEEQLLAPQMSAPIAMGGTVTAAYPAAVGDAAVQRAQSAPPPSNNWRERVGGAKAPVESYAARETVADTHLAEQQSRADTAGLQQNGVA